MKSVINIFLLFILFSRCSSPSPEKIFSQAALNTNLFFGFAGNADFNQLKSPSEKLLAGTTDKTEPMKRAEVVQTKIDAISSSYNKVKKLSAPGDAKEMVDASVALYEYILPVYKTEYIQLAKLYDDGASASQTQQFAQSIQSKYQPGFIALKEKLITTGKEYAKKHNIKVQWDVNTQP